MDRYWPERFTLVIGAVILAALLFLGSTGNSPTKFSDPWVDALLVILFHVGLKVLLPIWLVLRMIDILFLARGRHRF